VLLLVVAGLTVAAGPLLARPASPVRVVVTTVVGQALAHAALSLTAGHGGDASPASGARAVAHEHGAQTAPSHDHVASAGALSHAGRSVSDALGHLVDDLTSAGTPMLLTHLAAAVLVGAWLAAGERALWTLVTLAWRTLEMLVARALPCCPTRPSPTRVVVEPLLCRVTVGTVVRRGPPPLPAA
jgi:hypothetical protein